MRKGRCIYCNEEKELNKEHAFPRSLLQKGAPGWTIYNHSCEDCNKKLGKLDELLASRGPIGHTWNQIKSESGQETQDRQSYRYERRSHLIEPERMMVPDPILGHRIGLFKLIVEGSEKEEPLNSLEPLVPQIILTLYSSKELAIEEVMAKNAKRFASLEILSVNVSDTSESILIYCIGNPVVSTCTVVFPPEAIKHFHHKPQDFAKVLKQFDSIQKEEIFADFREQLHGLETELTNQLDGIHKEKVIACLRAQPQNFESKVSKQLDGIQKEVLIIKDGQETSHDQLTSFIDSVPIDSKIIVDKELYFKEGTYANLPRSENLRGRFLIDDQVEPYIWRAIAKIAFHCFLYHYHGFSGHESIFDGIKAFIYREDIANSFVTSNRNVVIENHVYSSNTHFHNISFFVHGQNIGCCIDLFTGLWNQPFSFRVSLAGKIENWNVTFDRQGRVPFYVNPKSEKKKEYTLLITLE